MSPITPSILCSFSDESPTDSGVPDGSSPATPAQPATSRSTRADIANRFMPSSLMADARPEGVARVPEQRGLAGNIRRPLDRRNDLPVGDLHGSLEDAADDAFLPPDLAFLQLPV